ncbi:glycosyl transferase group 1 [Paenibacillus alvei TS-15]|uniref:Glycosyl transferase group 1 n=1 Tax=Paenibacillus alvei TS-15 TaxID=1117108 RepID=S9U0A7_PAEAL|nr:glycosyltransferase [Paenibacillus alvei]EPY07916.1 glycosyl transferase group 1 [Paenibacillus alvei TS-15]
MRVAIVHDYINQHGGAERVLEAFMELYPDAPVYTLISDLSKMPESFRKARIHNSFIQKLPFSKTQYKKMLSLFPLAVEQFDLRAYDVILSTSSAFAKGVITNPNQVHICYCHTPMRYVWDLYHQYMEELRNPLFKWYLPKVLHKIRQWDYVSAQRVDHYIANSYNVANRIKKYYGKESEVIHPPVSSEQFYLSDFTEDYYLIVSRLIPYKRIDLVIEAFNKLGWPLVIIGDGYDRKRLESLSESNVTFMGYQPDQVIAEYYSKCKAFILGGEEDFGITPLEAQASGRPVLAYGKGGALETVISGETGYFFTEQSVDSIINALEEMSLVSFDPTVIRQHAESFSKDKFIDRIHQFISSKV